MTFAINNIKLYLPLSLNSTHVILFGPQHLLNLKFKFRFVNMLSRQKGALTSGILIELNARNSNILSFICVLSFHCIIRFYIHFFPYYSTVL